MAGKIPQQFIDDLLARINITDVVEGRVDKFKRTGKNYSGLCPFHKEKTPSFSVNPEKQFYYCFGCGAGGNAVSFLMEHDRLSFPEAIEELAKLAGMEVPREAGQVNAAKELHLKQQYSLLDLATNYYQRRLQQADASNAQQYLAKRGLSQQVIDEFAIGYAPGGWDNMQQHLSSKADNQTLEQSGLLIHNEEKDRYYDRFRDRIMFPIRDVRGRTIAFGGRVLTDEKPKYLNSPETDTFHKSRELYGLYEARKNQNKLQRLLIVEGYMDVVSLAQFGIHYAVATLGTATSRQHLERMHKIVPEVVFCFDGDAAGRQAAARALDTTLPVIQDEKSAKFLFLPEGEDPDTLIRKEGIEAFEQRIASATNLSDYFFRSLQEEHDLNSMDGRARFSSEAIPKINEMPPSILRQMMLDRVCEITGLEISQLNSVINLQQATPATTSPVTEYYPEANSYDGYDSVGDNYQDDYSQFDDNRKQRKKRKQERKPLPPATQQDLCNKAISSLIHYPELVAETPEHSDLSSVNAPNIRVLSELIRYLRSNQQNSLGTLVVDWLHDPELSPLLMQLNQISHYAVPDEIDPAAELRDALQRLLERRNDGELDQLLKKNRQSPLSSEEKARLQQLLLSGQNLH